MRSYPSHTAPTSSHTSERGPFAAMRRVKVALYVRVSTDKQRRTVHRLGLQLWPQLRLPSRSLIRQVLASIAKARKAVHSYG